LVTGTASGIGRAIALARGKEGLVGEGYNHFETLETLVSPYGRLGRSRLMYTE
jgi:NAD(P)-dependent dehydrogenase (short-subunit alcohol dehydrogenase family)